MIHGIVAAKLKLKQIIGGDDVWNETPPAFHGSYTAEGINAYEASFPNVSIGEGYAGRWLVAIATGRKGGLQNARCNGLFVDRGAGEERLLRQRTAAQDIAVLADVFILPYPEGNMGTFRVTFSSSQAIHDCSVHIFTTSHYPYDLRNARGSGDLSATLRGKNTGSVIAAMQRQNTSDVVIGGMDPLFNRVMSVSRVVGANKTFTADEELTSTTVNTVRSAMVFASLGPKPREVTTAFVKHTRTNIQEMLGLPLGPADTNRLVVVSFSYASPGLSAILIGDVTYDIGAGEVSMTRAARTNTSSVHTGSEIWYAMIPSGASIDLRIKSANSNQIFVAGHLFVKAGIQSATPVATVVAHDVSSPANTIAVSANGFVVQTITRQHMLSWISNPALKIAGQLNYRDEGHLNESESRMMWSLFNTYTTADPAASVAVTTDASVRMVAASWA